MTEKRSRLRQYIDQQAAALHQTLRVYLAQAGVLLHESLDAAASDLLNETVRQALAHESRYQPEREPRPWLLGIAVNLIQRQRVYSAQDARRQPLLHDLYPDPDEDDAIYERVAALASWDAAEWDAAEWEAEAAVQVLLEGLSADDQEVLRLAIIHELDGAALARALGTTTAEAMSLVSDDNILLTSVADGMTFNILALDVNDAGATERYQVMVMDESGQWQVGWLPADQVILDYNCSWIWSGASHLFALDVPIVTIQPSGPFAAGERVWITDVLVDQTAAWQLSYGVVNANGVRAVLAAGQLQYMRPPWLPYAADISPTEMEFFQVRLPDRALMTPVSRLNSSEVDGVQRWQVQAGNGQFLTLDADELMYPLLSHYFEDRTLGYTDAMVDPFMMPVYPTPVPMDPFMVATQIITQATMTAQAFLQQTQGSACWLSPINPNGVQTLWADASRDLAFVRLEGNFSAQVLWQTEVEGEVWYQVLMRQGDSEARGWLEGALVIPLGC
jgi:DNA-directed RNA polymerase specialized sigma24 family protein